MQMAAPRPPHHPVLRWLAPRFPGFGCWGTQWSRRVDSQTVKIRRNCANAQLTQLVRRLAGEPKELVLEIAEQQPDGRRLAGPRETIRSGGNTQSRFLEKGEDNDSKRKS